MAQIRVERPQIDVWCSQSVAQRSPAVMSVLSNS